VSGASCTGQRSATAPTCATSGAGRFCGALGHALGKGQIRIHPAEFGPLESADGRLLVPCTSCRLLQCSPDSLRHSLYRVAVRPSMRRHSRLYKSFLPPRPAADRSRLIFVGCAGAFIGPGVNVGEGAVVGAMACVTHDVEAWTVVAGNRPASSRDEFSRHGADRPGVEHPGA